MAPDVYEREKPNSTEVSSLIEVRSGGLYTGLGSSPNTLALELCLLGRKSDRVYSQLNALGAILIADLHGQDTETWEYKATAIWRAAFLRTSSHQIDMVLSVSQSIRILM